MARTKCSHGKLKTQCVECGGGSICRHGKRNTLCVECGGGSICTHGKQRIRCVNCKGSSICIHGKRRQICKECYGVSLCNHGRIRSYCKECHGGGICNHNKIRSRCKECNGGSICIHGLVRSQCKVCKGSTICDHGKYRPYCKDCQGSGICIHNQRKIRCKDCNPGYTQCAGCGLFTVGHNNLCSFCNPKSTTRLKYDKNRPEIKTLQAVQATFPRANIFHDTAIGTACGSLERPDMYFLRNWLPDQPPVWIVVEVDENAHSDRESTCEWKRVWNIPSLLVTTGIDHPTLFIRFNPGATDNVLQKRLPLLFETIQSMQPARDSIAVSVAFLYYTKTYPGSDLYLMTNEELEKQLELFKP